MSNTADLTNTIAELKKENKELRKGIFELTVKVRWFEEQFHLNQKRQFGTSSERSDDLQLQLLTKLRQKPNPSLRSLHLRRVTYKRRK